MLVNNLPFDDVPIVQVQDLVTDALEQMQCAALKDLPVADDDIFVGIISEDVLLQEDVITAIKNVGAPLIKASVSSSDHLLKAVSFAVAANVSVVPVTNASGVLLGCIKVSSLLADVANFMQLEDGGALIVLEIDTAQYSLSEITKIVESNDAQITQLNTSKDKDNGRTRITIRVNKLEVSDIVATFQRYDYHVVYYFGEELYANELKSNYENLINYLNI